MKTLFAMFVILASAFAVSPAHAGRTLDVELYGSPPTISPNPLIAQAGDVIRFSVINGARFDVEYYAQAGGDTPIHSGLMDGRSGQVQYQIEFGGGTVLYRDVYGGVSALDPNSGVCTGVCAVITDQTTTPIPPVIDQPSRTLRENPATVTGTAEPMTVVTLVQGSSVDHGTYKGQALTGPDGKWAVKNIDLTGQMPGKKSFIARAVRAIGYVSGDSAIVQYDYIPDKKAPDLLTFDPIPSPPVFAGPLTFSGKVRDDNGIGSVTLHFVSTQISTTNLTQPSAATTFDLPAECEPPGCPVIAPAQIIHWSFNANRLPFENDKIPAGVYQVTAVAKDTSGNLKSVLAPTGLAGQVIFVNVDVAGIYQSEAPEPVQSIEPSPYASPVVPVLPSNSALPLPSSTPTL